jgi:hypothetical protein
LSEHQIFRHDKLNVFHGKLCQVRMTSSVAEDSKSAPVHFFIRKLPSLQTKFAIITPIQIPMKTLYLSCLKIQRQIFRISVNIWPSAFSQKRKKKKTRSQGNTHRRDRSIATAHIVPIICYVFSHGRLLEGFVHVYMFYFNTVKSKSLTYTIIQSPIWTHARTPYLYEHLRETEPAAAN